MQWLSGLTDWFVVLFRGLWLDFIEFANDFWIGIIDQLLSILSSAINSIPVPSFFAHYSVANLLGSLPSDVLFFAYYLRLSEAFAIIGAAVSFRIARKVLTLFQW